MSSADIELTRNQQICYWMISAILVMFSGIFSGLTLALFSVDVMYLKVLLRTGSGQEKERAAVILPLLKHQHLTLVTLLLSNAMCMTALPVFLETLLDPVTSLIVSVTAVLAFGEVIPQATFAKNATFVGYFFAPLIWLSIGITFVVSYPVGKLLDNIVGHKRLALERNQLGEFLKLHYENDEHHLSDAEVKMMRGSMLLTTRTIKEAMKVKTTDMVMLSSNAALDKETIQSILLTGFSRIPVFKDENRSHILGVLLVKTLLPLAYTNPSSPPKTGDYHLREVIRISEEALVQDVYEAFQSGQSHMAIVYSRIGAMTGMLTLEDVLELLHEVSIADEMDTSLQPAELEKRQKQLFDLFGIMKNVKQNL